MDKKTSIEYNFQVLVDRLPYILMLVLVTLVINEVIGYKATVYLLSVLLLSMVVLNYQKIAVIVKNAAKLIPEGRT